LPDPKFLDPTEGPLPKPPSQNNGIQDLLTNPGYYWSTKYNTMVKMINTALTTAYNAFNAAHPGIHAAPAYLQYNPQSGLFSMVGLTSYATGANPAKVFVNALLYKYLDTIPARFYGYNRPGGCEYQIDLNYERVRVMGGLRVILMRCCAESSYHSATTSYNRTGDR
jgi:hypothetical protein